MKLLRLSNSSRVAPLHVLSQDLMCFPTISRTWRLAVFQGELDRTVEGPQLISRTDTCSSVQVSVLRGTATACALQNDLQRATDVNVFAQTIRNTLSEGGLRALRPVVGYVLTAQQRVARLAFAQEHQNWQVRHWRHVQKQVHPEHL